MNSVPIIKFDVLTSFHTGSLMSRRNALLKCEESFELTDRAGYEKKPKISETGYIEFKNTHEWIQAYEDIKKILATREDILNKLQRKELRSLRVKSSKNST